MVKLTDKGVFLVDGKPAATAPLSAAEACKNTIAYSILQAHNTSGDENKLQLRYYY